MASDFTRGLLLGFPALFSIIDPIGNVVIYSQMTEDRTAAERRTMAKLLGLFSLVLLLAALWAGTPVLHFFGVTLPALKVAGGSVVVATGWRLLLQEAASEANRVEARQAAAARATGPTPGLADFTFFPLTMPLTVGPGSISVSITLGATRPTPGLDLAYMLGVSLAAAANCLLSAVLFRYSDVIGRALGPTGSRAIKRIVALLLLCIGVQIMATGLQQMLIDWLAGQR